MSELPPLSPIQDNRGAHDESVLSSENSQDAAPSDRSTNRYWQAASTMTFTYEEKKDPLRWVKQERRYERLTKEMSEWSTEELQREVHKAMTQYVKKANSGLKPRTESVDADVTLAGNSSALPASFIHSSRGDASRPDSAAMSVASAISSSTHLSPDRRASLRCNICQDVLSVPIYSCKRKIGVAEGSTCDTSSCSILQGHCSDAGERRHQVLHLEVNGNLLIIQQPGRLAISRRHHFCDSCYQTAIASAPKAVGCPLCKRPVPEDRDLVSEMVQVGSSGWGSLSDSSLS